MLAKGKGKQEAVGRRNLRVQLVLERISGQPHDRNFSSWAMKQGAETEDEARSVYEARTGTLLTTSGFVQHDSLLIGCSLDGHTPDMRGLLEIKAPTSPIHLEYLRSGKVPHAYLCQITHGLYVTDADWCDWVSYDPSFPERLQMKTVRVTRGDVDLTAYHQALAKFLVEVAQEENEIRQMAEAAA